MFITEQQFQEQMRQSGVNTGSALVRPRRGPLLIGPNAGPLTDDILAYAVSPGKSMDPDIQEVLRFVADKNNTADTHAVFIRI